MMPLVLLPLEWLLLLLLTDALQLHTSRRQAMWNVFSLIFVMFFLLLAQDFSKSSFCGIGGLRRGGVCVTSLTQPKTTYLLLSSLSLALSLFCVHFTRLWYYSNCTYMLLPDAHFYGFSMRDFSLLSSCFLLFIGRILLFFW